jgi:hypothetical protein
MKEKTQLSEAVAMQRERDNIRTRNGSLIFLWFGTAISSALIGMELAKHFQLNWLAQNSIIAFCVVFGYFSVDSAVRNNLLASSDDSESEELKKYFKNKSIISLIFTVLFSVGASWFIGQISKSESPYEKFNITVDKFSKRDSTNKSLAATTLSNLTKEQKTDIQDLKKLAKSAELLLAKTFEGKPISKSWGEDYRIGKNKPSAYIWTCQTCPPKYKRWRNAIQKVRTNHGQQIAEIRIGNTELKKDLASRLAYSIDTDTTLAKMSIYTNQLEKERQNKAHLITLILILLTIAAAFGAYGANNNLIKLRAAHGQHVQDGDQLIFDVVEDFFNNLLRQFLGVLFGVLIWIDKGLEKIGIDLYEIKGKSIAGFSSSHPFNQVGQVDQDNQRAFVNLANQPPAGQVAIVGSQQLPTDQQIVNQSRPIGFVIPTQPIINQSRPIGQEVNQAPTSAQEVTKTEIKTVIKNVNISGLRSDCKKYYLRSFFPSNDSQYRTRKKTNPPAAKTLKDNQKRHLEKVAELAENGIKTNYIGVGVDRSVRFE